MQLSLNLTAEQISTLVDLGQRHQQHLETPGINFPPTTLQTELREALTAALFAQAGFDTVWRTARNRSQTLYLTHPDVRIRNLPWKLVTAERELLIITKTGSSPLSDHYARKDYPLKVLVMVSAPEGVARLAYEEEELRLLRAFSPLMIDGLVQVHFTDDGSLEDLQEKLEAHRYHILHFSGHGFYKGGEGYLVLENRDTGKANPISALSFNTELVKFSRKGHRPELIVLSACQTAQGVSEGNISGVADALIGGGSPAVIAMAASVIDACAICFTEHLFKRISLRYPLTDAFQEACLAVREFEKINYPLEKKGLASAQWLIPQLLLTVKVGRLITKSAKEEIIDFSRDAEYVRGERALLDLRVRPPGYLFVGRREQRRNALTLLRKGSAVLLRGQGGVGKTALAENLAVRLLAANPQTKVFSLSAERPKADALLNNMIEYIKLKGVNNIDDELKSIDKLSDKFTHMLHRADDFCDLVFVFDNVELFQIYDMEQRVYLWNQDKYQDIFELLHILLSARRYPVVITGRYQLAEVPNLPVVNLNTVPFGDYFRKCHQLNIRRISADTGDVFALKEAGNEQGPLSFENTVHLLYKYLGSNYRSLEFFDELYNEKHSAVIDTLQRLSELSVARLVPNEDEAAEEFRDAVIHRMGREIVFGELIDLLSPIERDVLNVLAQYNVPVLPMAVGMQRSGLNPLLHLDRLVALTLVERRHKTNGRVRYYITPLVRELLMEIINTTFTFDHLVAGGYHEYVLDNNLAENNLTEISEAFERYYQVKYVLGVNSMGAKLSYSYFNQQQFRLALKYGQRTEEVAKDQTSAMVLNDIGLISSLHGKNDQALEYLKKSLYTFKVEKNREGEGAALNNISQIYDAWGDYDSALDYLKQALVVEQEIEDHKGAAVTLSNIATILYEKSDYDIAIEYLEQSLSVHKKIGYRKGEATALNNMATNASAKKNHDVALRYLNEALEIQQEMGDRQGESITLSNMGSVAGYQNDKSLALEYFQKSLKINQEIGDRKGEGTTLSNISDIYYERADYSSVLDCLLQSAKIQHEISDHEGKALSFHFIGAAYVKIEQYEDATQYFLMAYSLFRKLDSPLQLASQDGLENIIKEIGQNSFDEILKGIHRKEL
jgi:tetratricopeptide (TPR) repeat protein